MAFTQEQLSELDAAIAEGVLTVRSNGREVTYRSLTEMMRLRDQMALELGVGGAGRKRRYFTFRRD